MKTTGCLRCLAAMAVLLAAATAAAQPRVRLGSQISDQPLTTGGARFSGGIAPAFDPYAPSQQPPVPLPVSAAPTQFGTTSPVEWNGFTGALGEGLRMLQVVHLQYTWLARDSSSGLGVDEAEVWATFAIPSFLYNAAPLMVTPGFGLHMWDGPSRPFDLPPQTYDSYIDFAWQPNLTEWLRADLGVRVGVYTDFDTLTTDSLRLEGRGILSLNTSPTMEWKVGVVYLDRLNVKMLPAGGVIWTPHPDARYEIFFPKPKLAQRLWTTASADWWGYVGGEYGGGSWTIRRLAGGKDQFDYNDIRIAFGLDRISHQGVKSFIEVAYVFDREVIYRSGMPAPLNLDDTVMVRGGIRY